VVLLALAAWLVAVPGLKAWRWRRRYRRAVTPRSAVVTAFEHFVAEASELATAPRPPSESAVAYARRIAPSEGGPVSPATDLALLYERAEYGPQQVSPADAVAARHLARLLRSRLWARASWWERAVRLFGPSGLLDSGARTFLPRAPRPRAYERAA
jgi:hypothetical protein